MENLLNCRTPINTIIRNPVTVPYTTASACSTVFLKTEVTVAVTFVKGCGLISEISLNVHVFHCDLCPKLSSYLLALQILFLYIDWGVSWSEGEGYRIPYSP